MFLLTGILGTSTTAKWTPNLQRIKERNGANMGPPEIHSNDKSINEWNACVCFSRIRSEGNILYYNDVRVICAL